MSAAPPVDPVVSCTFQPPRAFVELRGEFDIAVREQLADELARARLAGCTRVEVDARDVGFIDASCLRVLHQETVRQARGGGTLQIVTASAVMVRTVTVAGYADLAPHAAMSTTPA
ncbi:STAS domain-containing protein [Nocardioides sp.]|uniref:STAS domain-containing protein n=1 Tax=Nocardioides sp. TaxID=35761 RepID=UPI0035ADBBD4